MDDHPYERLRETSWRRKLSPEEEGELQAWLAQHPERSGDFEAELELTDALARLTNAPVPSNFTARVLREAERQKGTPSTTTSRLWQLPLRWLPRAAVAAVILAAGLFSYEHVQDNRRKERADSVREIIEITSVPGPEILQDFDAIQAMSQAPTADVELLKALQ